MALIDFFIPQKKEAPSVRGYSFGANVLNMDLSKDVFFKYYNLNPFIFSVINKRSNACFSKGWELRKEWQTEKIYNEDLKELIKFSTSRTPKEFFKRVIRDYDIAWESYIYYVKDEAWKKIWIQALDPRYIKPVANKQWVLLWFVQNLDWIKVYLKDEVSYIKDDNDIDNEIAWKSKMSSLFIDVETDQEARESNLAFFKNNQTPSSIIILDPEFEIDEDDEKGTKEKIKNMFESWKYEGWKWKHRSMMAQWIKEIVKVQDKISDMEFLELRKFTRELVYEIYEVPTSLWGVTDKTNYSNWNTQYDIYWDNIEALEDKFAEWLTEVLKEFDPLYVLIPLKDNLRKLVIKADIAWSLYKDKWIITLNESRKIIQYEDVKDWDKFFEVKTLGIWNNDNDKK